MDEMDHHDGAPENPGGPAEAGGQRSRIHFGLPEGWVGVLLLLIVAAVSGGLIATYWPLFFGGGDLGATQDRVATLESRVDQIAAGHAGAAANSVFEELRHAIAGLGQRLDADEARLTATEKSSEGGVDVAPLRQKLDAAVASLNDINARLAKVESGGGGGSAQAFNANLSSLTTRVGALEADIARAAQTLNGTVSGLDARLKALEANAPPPGLDQRLNAFALKTDEDALEARLKAIEAQNTGESLHHAATLLALARLTRAADEPGPFALELDTFAVASPGDPVIATLQPYAAQGVATKPMLSAQFPEMARAALDAEREHDARTLFARWWANIVGLVHVRRVGEAAGADTASRLARAQARLDVGDLASAAGEMRALKGPAAAASAPWLKDANARLQLDKSIADMTARVIAALATPAPATNPAPAPGAKP